MKKDIDRVLIYRSEIQSRIEQLAAQIAKIYSDGLVIVPIMSGAMIFVSDLIRYLPMKMKIGLMAVSSYQGMTSRDPVVLRDVDQSLDNKNILIVDDILDTGKTLALVANRLKIKHDPLSVRTCVLLARQNNGSCADFSGFEIGSEFVVGYGLDHNGYYRNYPHIAVLKQELYRD